MPTAALAGFGPTVSEVGAILIVGEDQQLFNPSADHPK